MQLNFLQEDLATALKETAPKSKPTTSSAPKNSTDLFGGLPLAPKEEVKVSATPEAKEKTHPEKNPDAMKTISEAADMLGVQQHVLRFWESRFSQIKPLKLRGGRRYYRPEDMEILSKIQHLLYKQGYTIKGALRAFNAEKIVSAPRAPTAKKTAAPKQIILTDKQKKQVSTIREELLVLKNVLRPYLDASLTAQ